MVLKVGNVVINTAALVVVSNEKDFDPKTNNAPMVISGNTVSVEDKKIQIDITVGND